jgi:1,2-diacylglycerol 3-beta-galactosyltransferase
LANHYLAWALDRLGRTLPLVTIVTDPVSVHPFWLTPDVTRCLVGSDQARRKALACGLDNVQVQMTGLPIDPRFVDGLTDRISARAALGWPLDLPAVLLVGGGEGMGQLYRTARAIDATCPGIQLAVVAGRNRALRARLEASQWQRPTHVYGFVSQMSRLMSAANLVVTKAGPGTIHEAFIAGRPLLLTGAIPGQECGNVHLVVEGGAGAWTPTPQEAAALVARWTGPDCPVLPQMASRARALAHPHAAADAADEIWRLTKPAL